MLSYKNLGKVSDVEHPRDTSKQKLILQASGASGTNDGLPIDGNQGELTIDGGAPHSN